jgi:hypothetical protein
VPRLPLNFGLPVLVALLLVAGYLEYGPERSTILALCIGLALWMAFSLNIGERDPEDPEAGEEGEEPGALEPPEEMQPLTEEQQRELEEEAVRHRPLRPP